MNPTIGPVAVLPPDGLLRPDDSSEETQRLGDDEVRKLVATAHDDVTRLLTEHRDRLDLLAAALLEHETLDHDDAYAAAGIEARPTTTTGVVAVASTFIQRATALTTAREGDDGSETRIADSGRQRPRRRPRSRARDPMDAQSDARSCDGALLDPVRPLGWLWQSDTNRLPWLVSATLLLSFSHQPLTVALVYGDQRNFDLRRRIFTWSPPVFVVAVLVTRHISLTALAVVAAV